MQLGPNIGSFGLDNRTKTDKDLSMNNNHWHIGPGGPNGPNSDANTVWRATTILGVRKGGKTVIAGDGQVSLGDTVLKGNARKVRRLEKSGVMAGFAGATADALTLFERLENKLEQYPAQLARAAVELTKDWRTDRYLRRLEAMLIVANATDMFIVSGAGDVIEPQYGVLAIGSGGNYATAAARALYDYEADAETIARKAMAIAGDICVYSNHELTVEVINGDV